MTIKKCDRCGACYDFNLGDKKEQKYQLRQKSPSNITNTKVIDLCPFCQEELRHWFENHKEE